MGFRRVGVFGEWGFSASGGFRRVGTDWGIVGRHQRLIVGMLSVIAAVVATVGVGTASAAPTSRIVSTYDDDPQQVTLLVYSAAMNKNIPVTVLTPRDRSTPSPTLYLLNGAGGGEDSATWDARTDYKEFFADKDVYVVTPIGGAFSYYTDWQRDDPVLGRNKWQTFLTKELSPLIDAQFNTTGRNAVAGISMVALTLVVVALRRAEYEPEGASATSKRLDRCFRSEKGPNATRRSRDTRNLRWSQMRRIIRFLPSRH